MATIVDIRSAAAGKSARPYIAPAKGSAEILIFTGVRYSRWDDGRTDESRSPAASARDRLDLDE